MKTKEESLKEFEQKYRVKLTGREEQIYYAGWFNGSIEATKDATAKVKEDAHYASQQ